MLFPKSKFLLSALLLLLTSAVVAACTRTLTQSELAFLGSTVGPNLNYEDVRIRKGNVPSILPRTGAITLKNTVYWESKTYRDDFIPKPPEVSYQEDRRLLAHEIVHVWQYQNASLTGYDISKVVKEHRVYGQQVYAYPKPLDPNRKLLSYRYEQQAQIVEDWLGLRQLNDPQAMIYERVIREVMPLSLLKNTVLSAKR